MANVEEMEYLTHIKEMSDQMLASELEQVSFNSQMNSAWADCPSHWQFQMIVEEIRYRTCKQEVN